MTLTDPATRAQAILDSLEHSYIQREPWIDVIDLAQEQAPDYEWVIEGLVERQGRILLTGGEGVGKSLAALTLAVQAAAGLPVLGLFRGGPMRVVYLDLEMGRTSIRRRARTLTLSARPDLAPGALVFHLAPDGLDVQDRSRMNILRSHIAELEPSLIIVDPLYKLVLTDGYERDIRPTLQFLDSIRQQFGSALILVHHLRKRMSGEGSRGRDASDVFGSSVLLRWPEITLILSEHELLKVEKDRDGILKGVRSYRVERGGQWPIGLAAPPTSQDELQVQVEDDVLGALSLSIAPLSRDEIRRATHRRTADVGVAIQSLEATGRVARNEQGRWALC